MSHISKLDLQNDYRTNSASAYYRKLTIVIVAVLLLISVVILLSQKGIIPIHNTSAYQPGDWITDNSNNISFQHPKNWKITTPTCKPNENFIELPGTISGMYQGKNTELKIIGYTSSKPYDKDSNNNDRCVFNTDDLTYVSDRHKGCPDENFGLGLGNGLKIHVASSFYGNIPDGQIVIRVGVVQQACLRETTKSIMTFASRSATLKDWTDGSMDDDTAATVNRQQLLKSQQFKDIKRFAESIETHVTRQ